MNFEYPQRCIYSVVMSTLTDSIARFCGIRELLMVAGVSARMRATSRDIERACEVVRDIMRGGSALDDVNKYSRIIRAQFPYGEARELSDEEFARRAHVLVAYRLGMSASASAGNESLSPAALMGFAMRGDRLRDIVDPYNALCMSMKSIVIGKKSREFFNCIAGSVKSKIAPLMVYMMSDSVGVDPRVVRFIDCAVVHDVAGARECIPEFSDNVLETLAVRDNMRIECVEMSTPINAVGPNVAQILIARKFYSTVIAHFARDTAIFGECISAYSKLVTKRDVELGYIMPSRDAALSCAAKNPDPHVFDIVYEMFENRDCISVECAIYWNYCEGFEVLQRAVRRIESRGIRATFVRIMDVRSVVAVTLPLYEDAFRAIDFILARCARDIIVAQTVARAAHFGEPRVQGVTVSNTYDGWSIIKYLGWCAGLFGERMSSMIARHLASAPWLVEKVKSRGAKQSWEHFDEVFKIV